MVKDPDGGAVRVMADVALFNGDYKQASKTSHLLGHMADAPCPLCRFTKSRDEGTRYTGPDSSRDISHVTTTRRTLSVVAAVKNLLERKGGPSVVLASLENPSNSESD